MTILRSGTSTKYSKNWGAAFGEKKPKATKKSSTVKKKTKSKKKKSGKK